MYSMTTITVSATNARNRFFELLDQVALGMQVIIKKDSKEIAILSPKKKKTDWASLIKATKESAGIFKNYNPNDNPLRISGAGDFLGKWDKGLKLKRKS